MKTFFGMTAAVLLVVSLLFVALPGTVIAKTYLKDKVAGNRAADVKKAAEEAAQAANAQAEKAKTDEEKQLAKQLVKQAESNAEVAGDLLEAAQKGEKVDSKLLNICEKIAKKVKEAAEALSKGKADKAQELMEKIAELESSLPTAANARAEMQRAGADAAGKNQTAASVDTKCIKWEEVCSLKEKKECQSLASPSSIATEHCTVVWQRECQQKCINPCSRSRHRHWRDWSCWQ